MTPHAEPIPIKKKKKIVLKILRVNKPVKTHQRMDSIMASTAFI